MTANQQANPESSATRASKRRTARGVALAFSLALCGVFVANTHAADPTPSPPEGGQADATATGADAKGAEAKKIFNQRCTGCHTFGKGVKVGPDLKGVTQRRSRTWLLSFIRSSQRMIESGDPTARDLFTQFKQQRMPDWSALSEAQINSVLDWFSVDGPERKEPDERSANSATPAEIAAGRDLFQGVTPLSNGGVGCATCHSVQEGSQVLSASLGPSLSDAYARYNDRALTLFLKKPCFQRMPDSEATAYLTPQESFALKAYLRQASAKP